MLPLTALCDNYIDRRKSIEQKKKIFRKNLILFEVVRLYEYLKLENESVPDWLVYNAHHKYV